MKKETKKYFDEIYKVTKRQAHKDYYTFYNSKINKLTLYDKLRNYESELKRTDNLIIQDPHPYYCKYFKNTDFLFYQFYNRSLLLKVDETKDLRESLYHAFYNYRITRAILTLEKSIPKYTFEMYENGLTCPYLQASSHIHNVSKYDLHEIEAFKTVSLSKLIVMVSNFIINSLRYDLAIEKNPIEIIHQQLLIFKNELDQFDGKASSIVNILSKLIISKYINFTKFDKKKLKQQYEVFIGERPLNAINKVYFDFFNSTSDKNNSYTLSEETIFFIINRVRFWFTTIIEGAKITEPFKLNESPEEYFIQSLNHSQSEADRIINIIKKNTPTNTEDLIDYYKFHFNEYRIIYNEFENDTCSTAIGEGNQSLFLYYYYSTITNTNLINNIKVLEKALTIRKVINTLMHLWIESDKNINLDFSSILQNCLSASDILHKSIVYNKEIFNKKLDIEMKLLAHESNNYLPFDFHVLNLASKLIELFELIIQNFSNIFDDLDHSEKGFFVFEKIKTLKRNTLNLDSFQTKMLNRKGVTNYSEIILEFFEIEAQYIRDMSTSNFNPFISTNFSTKINSEVKSFNYIYYNSRLSQLNDMMIYLISNGFISKNTKLTDFRKVFNDTNIETKIIWIKTPTEFSYFIKYLHNISEKVTYLKQKHWQVAVECFEMENKTPFDQKKLRTFKKPANYKLIEKAVNLI